jgi:hypothetical protein
MKSNVGSLVSGRKWILVAAGLPILVAAWWAFRPEKLWINQKVSEPHRSLRAPTRSRFIPGGWKVGRTKRSGEQQFIKRPTASNLFD